ncbi:MAG: aminomethyl-transferring glycine dehydrogenase [Shewanellaceae bacterium]|nr:aminomethyl-transferring glycine dehydrogenase [Shewanellaceae bacterium]
MTKECNVLSTQHSWSHAAFVNRHIGPTSTEQRTMLDAMNCRDLDTLIDATVPANIRRSDQLQGVPLALSETEALSRLAQLASQNQVQRSFMGQGYYPTELPLVIARNVLENPSWYTAYTPYQAEIAQGRLEALLNFQQVTLDLTGFDLASASLLDEATAAAEAMMLAYRVRKDKQQHTFVVATDVFPQVQAVVQNRAHHQGIHLVFAAPDAVHEHACFGVLVQQSNRYGALLDIRACVEAIKSHQPNALVAVGCDWLALMLLASPAAQGADIAYGSSQRFGVPMGYGGPHAAFFATKSIYKRAVAGRIIGVSKDARGEQAFRMAMQTREQHIRRDKANSNLCTSQVLLANIASFYAVYHGADGLKAIAQRVHDLTNILALGLQSKGIHLAQSTWFDTLTCQVPDAKQIIERAEAANVLLRLDNPQQIGMSLDELTTPEEVVHLWELLLGEDHHLVFADISQAVGQQSFDGIPSASLRRDAVLQHTVFQQHRTETEMLRYIKRLERKDYALDTGMIPLGSCTMKLNATAQMVPIGWAAFKDMHPFAPMSKAAGYHEMINELESWLCAITDFDAICMQPNSGAQGEYAGLLAIKGYLHSQGQLERDICLIPTSAHGTNPASATMVGFEVKSVACDSEGNIDMTSLQALLAEHGAKVACIMITYPSTHGVFEAEIQAVCEQVHAAGGQVYLDGANMNAQVGLTSPGLIGADVSHLNLHKTFAIPHGGGGPGMGPIGIKHHLMPFVAGHSVIHSGRPWHENLPVSAAPWGSAGILPISWMYCATLGRVGLSLASKVAILNANYLKTKLEHAYSILYQGEHGWVAHECIIDLRPFKASAGISELDVAKRLIDYGFHAPTMSFPVVGTLMMEPTESESLAELDRFIAAMLSIRAEIAAIEAGTWSREQNPLVFAPHTEADIIAADFESTHGYSRELAAFPCAFVQRHKFWPAVNRLDDTYGDRHFCCSFS